MLWLTCASGCCGAQGAVRRSEQLIDLAIEVDDEEGACFGTHATRARCTLHGPHAESLGGSTRMSGFCHRRLGRS